MGTHPDEKPIGKTLQMLAEGPQESGCSPVAARCVCQVALQVPLLPSPRTQHWLAHAQVSFLCETLKYLNHLWIVGLIKRILDPVDQSSQSQLAALGQVPTSRENGQ